MPPGRTTCGKTSRRAHGSTPEGWQDRRGGRVEGRWVQIAVRIKTDVAAALKAGDRDRVGALRLVLSELQRAAKEGGADELAVLRRERKRRRESEEAYRGAGRTDLADAEAYEAGVIDGYLPAELGDAELDALVAAAVAELDPQGPRGLGRGGRGRGPSSSPKVGATGGG